MMKKTLLLTLGLLGSIVSAKTIDQRLGKAYSSLYERLEKYNATDQFSQDFMTIYEGIKEDQWDYPEKVTKGAWNNARTVSNPSNMVRTINKHLVSKKESVPEQTALRSISFPGTKGCCGGCIQIFQDDIDNAINNEFKITQPGKYIFAEDIIAEPGDQNPRIAIITIDSDDVVLDLCGHKFSLGDGSTRITGIEIKEDHQNITITNGTICNFTAGAIHARVRDEKKPLDTLCFSHLTITDNKPREFDGIFGAAINLSVSIGGITNIVIRSCKILRNSTNGIFMVRCRKILIEDTQCNDTLLTETIDLTRVVGAFFIACNNVRFFRNSFNNTRQDNPNVIGTTCAGARFELCENLHIEGCQFNETVGQAGIVCVGIVAENIKNALFKQCQFNDTRGGNRSELIAGFSSSSSAISLDPSENMKFLECQSHGSNIIPSAQPSDSLVIAGMVLSVQNLELNRCQASQIGSDNQNADVYGFLTVNPRLSTTDTSSMTFCGCTASDIVGTGKGKNVCGFAALSQLQNQFVGSIKQLNFTNFLFQTCTAERIHGTDQSAHVAGIAQFLASSETTNGIFSQLRNVSVKECTISDVQGGTCDTSAGILLESVKKHILCDNCVNDCVTGILLTGNKRINPPTGFQLATTEENALAEPPIAIKLTPGNFPVQTFKNLTRGNQIMEVPFVTDNSVISTPIDLNTLNWKAGDTILYSTNGSDPIPGLENNTKDFLIVYRPCFTECGLVQNNKITNCSQAGIKDNSCPTRNIFLANSAFKNGTPFRHIKNYCINWADEEPICCGDLGIYPCCNKAFNLSLIPGKPCITRCPRKLC